MEKGLVSWRGGVIGLSSKAREAVLSYLEEYWSVGDLRILLDLEKRGYSPREVKRILRELEAMGVIEYNRKLGVINYLPVKTGVEKPKRKRSILLSEVFRNLSNFTNFSKGEKVRVE